MAIKKEWTAQLRDWKSWGTAVPLARLLQMAQVTPGIPNKPTYCKWLRSLVRSQINPSMHKTAQQPPYHTEVETLHPSSSLLFSTGCHFPVH